MEGMPQQLVVDRGDVAPAPDVVSDDVTGGGGGGDRVRDPTGPSGVSGWLRRGGRPWWSTPAMVLIGVLAGALYLHQLSHNAMLQHLLRRCGEERHRELEGFLLRVARPSSFITVDKPPASLWVMEISGRIFGFSSISMLAPIALAGAVAVVVIFHLVRRWMGDVAAVLAATALAVTPVFTAIFRSDEPDAIMTLFLVLAAWALWSALETGATSRLVICSGCWGMAFLTKMLEAFVVLPAFRPRLSPVRPTKAGASAGPVVLGRAGPRRRIGLVGGHRRAVAGGKPSLRRQQRRQLRAQPHLRLQRFRAAPRHVPARTGSPRPHIRVGPPLLCRDHQCHPLRQPARLAAHVRSRH